MISQKQLGIEMEKKFKYRDHIINWFDNEVINLTGFVNSIFGIDESSFNRPDTTEESELWDLISK